MQEKMNDFGLHHNGMFFGKGHKKADSAPIQFDLHCHRGYELYLFLDGSVNYRIENNVYLLQPCDLLVIKPHQLHFPSINVNTPYERIIFQFNEEHVPPEFLKSLRECETFFRLTPESPVIRAFFRFVNNYSKFDEQDMKPAMSSLLTDVLLELKYVRLESAYESRDGNTLLNKAIRYINENIGQKLTMRDISKALYVSPAHLSHIFSANFPISIMRYVKHKNIIIAESLIKSGKKPLEASLQCGFESYSTFYRCYKQMLNKKPEDDYAKTKRASIKHRQS